MSFTSEQLCSLLNLLSKNGASITTGPIGHSRRPNLWANPTPSSSVESLLTRLLQKPEPTSSVESLTSLLSNQATSTNSVERLLTSLLHKPEPTSSVESLLTTLLSNQTTPSSMESLLTRLQKPEQTSSVESLLTTLLKQSASSQTQPARPTSLLEQVLSNSKISLTLKSELLKLSHEELYDLTQVLNQYTYGVANPFQTTSTNSESNKLFSFFTPELIIQILNYFMHCVNRTMTYEIMYDYMMTCLNSVSTDLNRNGTLANALCLFCNLKQAHHLSPPTSAVTHQHQPTTSGPSTSGTSESISPAPLKNPEPVSKSIEIEITDNTTKEEILSSLIKGASYFSGDKDAKPPSVVDILQLFQQALKSSSTTTSSTSPPSTTPSSTSTTSTTPTKPGGNFESMLSQLMKQAPSDTAISDKEPSNMADTVLNDYLNISEQTTPQ